MSTIPDGMEDQYLFGGQPIEIKTVILLAPQITIQYLGLWIYTTGEWWEG